MVLKRATVLLTVLILLSVGSSLVNGADRENFPRHVNPSKIEGESPDPRALFRIYSLNLKSISTGNWENAEHFLQLADYAYLPPDLQPLNLDLLDASRNLKIHLHRTDLNINNALASASSADFLRALEELFDARFSLAQSERDLRNVDHLGEELGGEMGGVPDFFTENLRSVENLLQSYYSAIQVLLKGGDWENVPDVALPTDNFERLKNLVRENMEGGFPGIGQLVGGENLIGTEITIGLGRDRALIGTRVKVKGALRTENGAPLPGRGVSIHLDGRRPKNVLTGENGRYSAEVRIPYIYRDEVSLRSVYLPGEGDLGTFTPAISGEARLGLLYDTPSLKIEAPGEVYPGRSFETTGKLTLDGEPLSNFSVNLYWLNTAENTATGPKGNFSVDLPVPPNTTTGVEEMRVESLPSGRVGPAEARIATEITRLVPKFSFDNPSLSLWGADLTITGEVKVGDGSIENPKIILEMGDETASTRASREGKFKVTLDTTLSSFSGQRDFSIHVYPEEPWIRTATGRGEILFLNPLTISIALIAFVSFLVFWRLKGKSEPGPSRRVEIGREEPVEEADEGRPEGIKGAFFRAVKAVVEVTGLSFRANQTIREYLSEVREKMGRAYEPFERLGLKFEEYLYSDHEVKEDQSLLERLMGLVRRSGD